MKKLILLLLFTGVIFGSNLVVVKSNKTVEETTSKIVKELKTRGFHIFQVLDHSKHINKNSKFTIDENTRVILFDKPEATKAMFTYSSAVMLEVPFKIAVYQTLEEDVFISYKSIDTIIQEHSMEECKFLKHLKKLLVSITKEASN